MIIPNSVSDAIVEDIRKAAGAWTPDQLQALLKAGRRTRAADYDTIVRGLAQRYVGDQQQLVKGALTKAYPRTGDKMPVDPVNWLRFFARQDSGVYQTPPKRTLTDGDDGAPLPEEDPRVEALGEALEQIGVDVLMNEAERRCATGARAAAVLVGYRRIGSADDGKAVAHLYWPHDVVTMAHHSAPDDVDALWFVALKQATEHDKDAAPLWWVWSREWTEDDAGNLVSFTPWTHRRVNETGTIVTPSETYEGRLPVAFVRTEAPAGGFWPEPDRDVSVNVDHLNVARSNRQHLINLQAHAQLVYSGTMRDTSELVVGPDAAVQVATGETLAYLTPSADHASIEASATRDLQELGVSRGNSPDAYSVEPGAPQSGVSRLIANAPHDQRVAEMRPIFEEFEEQHLLPIVIDVLERFSPTAPADFGGAYVEVVMGTGKTYEDDAIKTQRVLDLLAAKIVDEADARVMLGLSGSREEAQAYLDAKAQAVAPVARLAAVSVGGSPFTSMRETSAGTAEE